MANDAFQAEAAPGTDLDEVASKVLKKAARSSPWLLLSLIFHAAILGVLPFIIYSEQLREAASIPITIGRDAKRIDPERNYKPAPGGPPSIDGRGLEEPPVFFPDALPADRNESRGAKEDKSAMDGETLAVLTHLSDRAAEGGWRGRKDFDGPATNDTIGVGGGSGRGSARFGGKAGGRMNLAARGGGSAATEAGVEAGLVWLAKHQNGDGGWGPKVRCGKCNGDGQVACDTAATALSVCAFLAAGYNPSSKEGLVVDRSTGQTLAFSRTVKAGLDRLLSLQQKDGLFGKPNWSSETSWPVIIYGHAFATLALSEATRMTNGAAYRDAAQKGIRWLEANQNPESGWQYYPKDGRTDTSVTGACVQALKSARMAHLEIKPATLEGVGKYIESVTDAKGIAGYMSKSDGDRPPLTAIGIYVRRFLNPHTADRRIADAAHHVGTRVVESSKKGAMDYYFWYYSMLSLFELEGARGDEFRKVNATVTTALVKLQHPRADGCLEGSWDCAGDVYMQMAGRAATTALNVLTLEVYYRYAPVVPEAPSSSTPASAEKPKPVDAKNAFAGTAATAAPR